MAPRSDQRWHHRWETHVQMTRSALATQQQQWAKASQRVQQPEDLPALEARAPTWRRWWWRCSWGQSDRQRWLQQRRRFDPTVFLHDLHQVLQALPVWIQTGEQGLRMDPEMAESLWERWCMGVLYHLDVLLDAHPHRRGNVMLFRGLRHTLRTALNEARSNTPAALP